MVWANRLTRRNLRKSKSFFRKVREVRAGIEQLERREMMASDLAAGHETLSPGDIQLLRNWVPETRSVPFAPVSIQANALTPSTVADQIKSQASLLVPLGADSPTFRISDLRVDSQNAATYVYLQQTLNDKDIVNAYANMTILPGGSVIQAYSSFVPTSKATSSVQFAAISPTLAVQSLAKAYSWTAGDLVETTTLKDNQQVKAVVAPSLARAPINYSSVYVPTADGTLDLAWRLNVQAQVGDAWLDASVDALDGKVLFAADWNSDAQYQVFALPKESPTDGGRTILTDPQNTTSSPFGWHDTDGVAGAESTLTIGNNTNAYRDTDANNLPDAGSSPDGGANLVFTPALDLAQQPSVNANASTVNLFYMTNRLHDVFAFKGFDAAAGNFQVNNYGAGGIGNDPLLAEDLDGFGLNNANMATPPDGTSPRMQMFIWNQTNPNRSGSFDNGVIAHEFGHGVTNRLTGGPANSSALNTIQSGGMGEGWSDFFALMFTQVAADTAVQGRGIGTYVLGQPADGLGIRSQKYSYDMAVNSHTFGDIIGLNSVHDVGEIWATTLWDLNWALISGSTLDANLPNAGLGFNSNLVLNSGGNNMALKLVVAALKLQPANPTFLQARDAILAADQLLNNGLYQETIWKVFARRGMGVSAFDGGTSSTTAVEPAFDVPIIGNIPFQRRGALGSTIASVDAPLLPVVDPATPVTAKFAAEAGSKTSFLITPSAPGAVLTVRILKSNLTVALGPIVGAAGAPVSIPAFVSTADSQYTLEVKSNLPTRLRLEGARNAGLESSIGDSTNSNELVINNVFRNYGGGSGIQGAVGKSSSGLTLTKSSSPATFIDISATGTALNLSDDGEVNITTTVGNSIFPAGPVRVGNNGGILVGTVGDVSASNASISTLPLATPPSLFPYWDDIDSDTGNVYWQELSVGGIQTLIVQWENRPHFSNFGSVTFQLQLFASGPVLAKYVYKDVVFGTSSLDNGASATVGLVTPTERKEFSFNTASVADGDVISIASLSELDEYEFTGVAGSKVDVVLDALDGASLGKTTLRLLSSTGTVLATGTAKPLSAATAVGNYDLGILGFTLPTAGVYTVRITSNVNFDYYVGVTEDFVLDTENANNAITPIRTLSLPGAMLGYIDATDARDLDEIQLTAGQAVRLTLSRPGDLAGMIPANNLAPRLTVVRPNGTTGATTTTLNAQGRMTLVYTPTETGLHRIDVRRVTGQGEYEVHVALEPAALDATSQTGPQVTSNSLVPSSGQSNNFQSSSLPTTAALSSSIAPAATPLPAWQNFIEPMDVSGDDEITPLDILLIVNELNGRSSSDSTGNLVDRVFQNASDPFYDTNGDGKITPLDALLVINHLNTKKSTI